MPVTWPVYVANMENGHLRVGTSQRENAVEILRNAAAEDRITFDELDARVEQALGARTRGELAEILSDLVPTTELDRAAVNVRTRPSKGCPRPRAWNLSRAYARGKGPGMNPDPFAETHARPSSLAETMTVRLAVRIRPWPCSAGHTAGCHRSGSSPARPAYRCARPRRIRSWNHRPWSR